MPNTKGTNATNAPALPSLDALTFMAASELPQPATRSADLSADEKALAAAIIERTAPDADGNAQAARGPVITNAKADVARDQATSAAARIKRLLARSQKATAEADRITFTSRVVANGDGFSWVILRVPPKAVEAAAAEGEAEGAAEGSAG